MSQKNESIFKMEFKHSLIQWGCENSSEGEDYYMNFILPFNVGDEITRNDNYYILTNKDWDYDNNIVYFIFTRKKNK